jgi:hypothetical protein
MQTNVKRWLNENLSSIRSRRDQLEEPEEGTPRVDSQSRNSEWIKEKLEILDRLEQELKPVEWLAQSVWRQAGKMGLFDFDELYGMVGPSDEVKCGPFERFNLRSKLDELLSRILDANDILGDLSALIDFPVMRVNRLSSVIKLVRTFLFIYF